MKKQQISRMSPDEQQELMHALSGTTRKAKSVEVVKATEPEPPAKAKRKGSNTKS